jgi:hypothetical protein
VTPDISRLRQDGNTVVLDVGSWIDRLPQSPVQASSFSTTKVKSPFRADGSPLIGRRSLIGRLQPLRLITIRRSYPELMCRSVTWM